MKRTSKYVGLDVHQATTVIVVREESGRIIVRTIVPTEATPLTEFFRSVRGSVHVSFEEGTQSHWLYTLLVPLVMRVVVCNRRDARGIAVESYWERGGLTFLDADGYRVVIYRGSTRTG